MNATHVTWLMQKVNPSLEEYEHYLDLLDDEEDSQDPSLTSRLAQAADHLNIQERISFRDYVQQRQSSDDKVSH